MIDSKSKFEEQILAYGYADAKYVDIILNGLNTEHLEGNYQSTFNFMKKYYHDYNAIVPDGYIDNLFNMGKVNNDSYNCFKILRPKLENYQIIDTAHLKATIDLFREVTTKDKMLKLANNIAESHPTQQLIKQAKEIVEFDNYQYVKKNIFVNIRNAKKRFDEYLSPNISENIISSGFKAIDKAIGGFKRKELVYVIGRKGAGKSILLFNFGYNAWKNEKNVLFITLEIDKDDYVRRVDSFITGIPALTLKMKNLDEAEKLLLKSKMRLIEDNCDEDGVKHTSVMHVIESSANINVNNIKQIVKEQERKQLVRYDVIVLDYASLLSAVQGQREDRLKHGQIAFELKNFAKDEDYLVISAAQMNRAGEREEIVTSGNIANSDSIADHIDYGIAIVVDKDPMIRAGKITSFKTRDGSPFSFSINKKYDVLKIEELDETINNEWSEN